VVNSVASADYYATEARILLDLLRAYFFADLVAGMTCNFRQVIVPTHILNFVTTMLQSLLIGGD
jgi:hypothetical protein